MTGKFTMVQTVDKNYRGFTIKYVKLATLARKDQSVGNLPNSKFKLMTSNNNVKKYTVNPQNT